MWPCSQVSKQRQSNYIPQLLICTLYRRLLFTMPVPWEALIPFGKHANFLFHVVLASTALPMSGLPACVLSLSPIVFYDPHRDPIPVCRGGFRHLDCFLGLAQQHCFKPLSDALIGLLTAMFGAAGTLVNISQRAQNLGKVWSDKAYLCRAWLF